MKKIVFVLLVFGLMGLPATGHAQSKSVTVTVKATVPPLFELSVGGPTNGDIEFGVIHRDTYDPVYVDAEEVVLTARSNLGTPYQITHALVTPFANENNDQFSEEDFTINAENLETGGQAIRNGTLSTTPSTLFISNGYGKSDTVKANYRLRVNPEQASGQYQSKLIYTISTF